MHLEGEGCTERRISYLIILILQIREANIGNTYDYGSIFTKCLADCQRSTIGSGERNFQKAVFGLIVIFKM